MNQSKNLIFIIGFLSISVSCDDFMSGRILMRETLSGPLITNINSSSKNVHFVLTQEEVHRMIESQLEEFIIRNQSQTKGLTQDLRERQNLAQQVIQARRRILSGTGDSAWHLEIWKDLLQKSVGSSIQIAVEDILNSLPPLLRYDAMVIQQMIQDRELSYPEAAKRLLEESIKEQAPVLAPRFVTGARAINLSDLARRLRYVHSLGVENFRHKMKDLLKHLTDNLGQIRREGQLDMGWLNIIETQEGLYLIQGSHRVAALVTLFNTGILSEHYGIGDLVIPIHSLKAEKTERNFLESYMALETLMGWGHQNIDLDQLEAIAREIYRGFIYQEEVRNLSEQAL